MAHLRDIITPASINCKCGPVKQRAILTIASLAHPPIMLALHTLPLPISRQSCFTIHWKAAFSAVYCPRLSSFVIAHSYCSSVNQLCYDTSITASGHSSLFLLRRPHLRKALKGAALVPRPETKCRVPAEQWSLDQNAQKDRECCPR